MIEAVTSGTAFQPRNDEEFNELGINMIDSDHSDVVGHKKRKKRVKSDQVSFMSLSINIKYRLTSKIRCQKYNISKKLQNTTFGQKSIKFHILLFIEKYKTGTYR